MDRIHAAGFVAAERPLLGQMAIATVLVGSAAALSSASVAVPVNQVGYGAGWDRQAPAAPRIAAPSRTAVPAPPVFVPASAPPVVAVARVEFAAPTAAVNSLSSVPATPRSIATSATRIESAPALAAVPVAPLPELAVPPAPLAAAPSLAVPQVMSLPQTASPGDEIKLADPAPPLRLVNPPELRGFDLAKLSGPGRAVPTGFARPAVKSPVSGKVEGLGRKDTVVGDAVFHQVSVSVAGSDSQAIDVRIGADMKPSIKVGDLLALVSDRMDPDSAARFAAASSAGDYVSLATLRAAGFEVSYNAGADSISITAAQ